MTYSLFIDDERHPPSKSPIGNKWVVVRTMHEAIDYINAAGFPAFISFDHDLGPDQPTGYDFAKWIVERDLEDDLLPENFKFEVHSQNPVGAENIKRLLINYLKFKNKQNSP